MRKVCGQHRAMQTTVMVRDLEDHVLRELLRRGMVYIEVGEIFELHTALVPQTAVMVRELDDNVLRNIPYIQYPSPVHSNV